MPTTRLADVTSILSRIRDHNAITLTVYTRPYDPSRKFDIELDYKEEGNLVRAQAEGADFMDTLIKAWQQLERLCHKGAGPKSLEPPAIEYKALPETATANF